ncbi:MAG: matrixin family metalloprotease, partial [Phycisphaerales bacterium]|nr:matrixin family metalloprotease [Phycisphaerales bacterium]
MVGGIALALMLAAGQAGDVAPALDVASMTPAQRDALARIEKQTFFALPEENRRLIIGRIGSGDVPAETLANLPDWMVEQFSPEAQDERMHGGEPGDYTLVADIIDRETFEAMPNAHQRMLVGVYQKRLEVGHPLGALCFAPGTPPEVVEAFSIATGTNGAGPDFEPGTRWSNTASGSFPGAGNPVVLTWSIVPDGTFVPNAVGLGYSGPSTLRAFLTGIYGNQQTWIQIYDDMFARWAELGGLSYVYEPNDDGSNLNVSGNGQIGVRGDLRMAGIPLDGNSGVLAYNNFPADGDMVIDTGDSFYTNTANNSLRLRNVIAHEHGHGQGLFHVCPANQTKLMEPFISTAYNGPQLDDILATQWHYGDNDENNDTAGTATNLGPLSLGQSLTRPMLSIDRASDVDFYTIQVGQAAQITATMTPTGAAYAAGTQTSQCNSGPTFSTLDRANLEIAILASNGTTVIANAAAAGLGAVDTAIGEALTPGTYYVRIRQTSQATSDRPIQAYTLGIAVDPPPFPGIIISLPSGAPTQLDPGQAEAFSVTIDPRQESIVGTPQLLYRTASGQAFASINLSSNGGTSYTATIPGLDCAAEPEFYVAATGSVTGLNTSPTNAPAEVYSAIVGTITTVLSDNFQTNMGWIATADATTTTGFWDREVPNPSFTRGEPTVDADGSGICYVSGNTLNEDIDGGAVYL